MKPKIVALIMAAAWLALSFISTNRMIDIGISQAWCAVALLLHEIEKRNNRTND